PLLDPQGVGGRSVGGRQRVEQRARSIVLLGWTVAAPIELAELDPDVRQLDAIACGRAAAFGDRLQQRRRALEAPPRGVRVAEIRQSLESLHLCQPPLAARQLAAQVD